MKITGAWLEAHPTQTVCATLESGGHQALFVGGCVRNALLGKPVADVDIATDAHPDRVCELAVDAGLRAVATGRDHGTVTVIADGVPHEVTTFRRDVETFGRHAVVAYSDDLHEDARRRDFTMNALYADARGEVFDPLDAGLHDLAARRVRFVGTAENRIREDYLRILRFFRFFAWYGDPQEGPDADGLAACASQTEGLDTLSRERVGAEMRRLLGAPDPAPAVAAMQSTGALGRVLPGADARALPVLVHLEGDAPANWLRRLAVLGGPEDIGRALRLSKAEARELDCIMREMAGTRGPAELGYRHGPWLGADIVLARAAILETPPARGWREAVGRGSGAEFPVRPADLMPTYSGPALGAKLRELEDRWIAADFRPTREELLA